MLVQNKVDLVIISLKINLFWLWYSWTIAELALNNNHSLIDTHFIPTTTKIKKGQKDEWWLKKHCIKKKPKDWLNMNITKIWGWTQMIWKDKQFLLHYLHQLWYLC